MQYQCSTWPVAWQVHRDNDSSPCCPRPRCTHCLLSLELLSHTVREFFAAVVSCSLLLSLLAPRHPVAVPALFCIPIYYSLVLCMHTRRLVVASSAVLILLTPSLSLSLSLFSSLFFDAISKSGMIRSGHVGCVLRDFPNAQLISA